MKITRRTPISKSNAWAALLITCFISPMTISVSATTIYVDDSNVSGIEDGTPAHPYNTIEEGMDAAAAGDTVSIAAGSYLSPGDTLFIKPGLTLIGEQVDNTIINGDIRDTTDCDLADELHRLRFNDFVFYRPMIEAGEFDKASVVRECQCDNIFISHGGGSMGDTLGPIPYFDIEDNTVQQEIAFNHAAGMVVGENLVRNNSAHRITLAHGYVEVTDIVPIPAYTYLIEENILSGGIECKQGAGWNTLIIIHDNEADSIGLRSGWLHTYEITDNTVHSDIFDHSGACWTTISGNTILNGRIMDSSKGFEEGEDEFIENNTIYYQATGKQDEDIAIQASSASVTIRNNTIVCTGTCSGMELRSGWPTNVIDNEITLEADESGQTFGILTKAGGGIVTDNIIQGGYFGYYTVSGCTLFANNQISGAHTGFWGRGAEVVRDNIITGCSGDGMILDGGWGPFCRNVVTGNDSAGIRLRWRADLGGGTDGMDDCVGGNIIRNNGYCDLVVDWIPDQEETLFVKSNIWDHDTAEDILATDICNDGGSELVIIDFSDFEVRPQAPVLLAPADGITDAGLSPQLVWSAPEGAEEYWLQVSEDSTFAAKAADTSGITDTTFTLTGLSPDTEYFWHVAAGNLAGYGDWSPTWRFIGQITVGLSVTPDSLGFGEIPVGGDTSLALHIKSTGTNTLQVSDINASDPVFTLSDTAFSLAPAESIYVTVTFTPDTTQDYSGTLTIHHNAAKGTTVIPVAGLGTQSKPVVLSMTLSDPSPTGPGPVDFTFTFDRKMDVSVEPDISYGLAWPYEDAIISAHPGWAADSLSWTGLDTIAADSVVASKWDGLNTVRIQGAQDPEGRMMNPDVSRTFFIDITAPFSWASSPEYASTTSFTVRWLGLDDNPSSGIASYSVYASEDGGLFTEWVADTTVTAAVYAGAEGHFYSFYSIATDSAGNRQPTPTAPQCSTSFDLYPPQITATTIWTDTSFGGPFAVNADIEDSVGIGLALLWYRTDAETLWQADTMTASKDLYEGAIPEQMAPDSKDLYQGTIPEQSSANTVVEYYVRAEDVAEPANSRTDPVDAPEEVYSFTAYMTGVASPPFENRPGEFVLHQNAPNPFNAGTLIRYTLPADGQVHLEVFNILGQKVAVLVDAVQQAGEHTVRWEGRDGDDRMLSSGVYLCRLSAEGRVSTRRMVLLR